jgi:hypothetical protein
VVCVKGIFKKCLKEYSSFTHIKSRVELRSIYLAGFVYLAAGGPAFGQHEAAQNAANAATVAIFMMFIVDVVLVRLSNNII